MNNILFTDRSISIFGNQLKGRGIFVDLSDASDIFDKCDMKDQNLLQKYIENCMKEKNTNWAVSDFGEYREKMFRILGAEQMVSEKRFYHLGTDVWAPKGYKLFSPLDGIVEESGYEDGFGNYGGYILLFHDFGENSFYSFYGHLNPDFLLEKGTKVRKGDEIGKLGSMSQNGGYFYHTHVQVITKLGYEKGFISKGYTDGKTFHEIKKYVLNPLFLILS